MQLFTSCSRLMWKLVSPRWFSSTGSKSSAALSSLTIHQGILVIRTIWLSQKKYEMNQFLKCQTVTEYWQGTIMKIRHNAMGESQWIKICNKSIIKLQMSNQDINCWPCLSVNVKAKNNETKFFKWHTVKPLRWWPPKASGERAVGGFLTSTDFRNFQFCLKCSADHHS